MMPAYAMHEPGSGSSATNVSPAAFGRDANSTSVLDETPEFTRQRPGGVFLVISGPDRGEQAVLRDSSVTVGSAPGCELVLSDRTVSRRHITASLENHQVVVRDLSSTNGSFTHGSRFKEIVIGHGAELQLGKTMLKFLPREEALEPEAANEDNFGELLGHDASQQEAPVILDSYGNTSSAGSIIAFHLFNQDLPSGARGVLCSFGAGYSIGSLLLQRR